MFRNMLLHEFLLVLADSFGIFVVEGAHESVVEVSWIIAQGLSVILEHQLDFLGLLLVLVLLPLFHKLV